MTERPIIFGKIIDTLFNRPKKRKRPRRAGEYFPFKKRGVIPLPKYVQMERDQGIIPEREKPKKVEEDVIVDTTSPSYGYHYKITNTESGDSVNLRHGKVVLEGNLALVKVHSYDRGWETRHVIPTEHLKIEQVKPGK